MKTLRGACLMITEKCNMVCPMCYAYRSNNSNFIDLKKAYRIIEKLKSIGIIKITFTGGEPMLHNDLFKIIKYAQNQKLKVALSTNGSLLTEENLSNLEFLVDEITIPIDGHSRHLQGLHRDFAHYSKIINLLNIHLNYQINFDVSTVVTERNINDLYSILILLEKYKIKKWKIFQYSCLNNHKFDFEITTEEFTSKINELIKQRKYPMQIDIRNSEIDNLRSYLNISTLGDVFIINENYSYTSIGNILTSNISDILNSAKFNYDYHFYRHKTDY